MSSNLEGIAGLSAELRASFSNPMWAMIFSYGSAKENGSSPVTNAGNFPANAYKFLNEHFI